MFIIICILVIYVFYLLNKIKGLNNEILKLRIYLTENKIDIETGKQINNEESITDNENNKTIDSQNIKIDSPKENILINNIDLEKIRKDRNNTLILVGGAICIILSALVFLMSTWNTIPNILKTIVLVLLTMVFYASSYIADKKLKLKKAGQTFFYLAQAYVPICLLSISVFKLFGHYLSIYGDGKYIYTTFSCLLLSVLYYYIYKCKNNKVMLKGSIISQIFFVVSTTLIYSNDLLLILISLLLYNIIIIMFTKEEIFSKLYNFITYSISIISIIYIFGYEEKAILLYGLICINYIFLLRKEFKKPYVFLLNIFIIALGIFTIKNYISLELIHLIDLIYITMYFIIEYIIFEYLVRKDELLNSGFLITLISLTFLFIFNLFDTSQNIIQLYMISLVQTGILLFMYIKNKFQEYKNIIITLISILFIISGLNILSILECSYHYYVIFSLIVCIFNELIALKDKEFYNISFIVSNIFISLTYLIVLISRFDDFKNDLIYLLLLLGYYIYNYLINKKETFKYVSYFSLNLVLFSFFNLITTSKLPLYYIPAITSLIIILIELKKNNNEITNIYMLVNQFIAYIFMYLSFDNVNSNNIYYIIIIGYSCILVINNIYKNKEKNNILPLTCVIPSLFLVEYGINEVNQINLILSISSITIMNLLSLKNNRLSVYTIYSVIYMILTLFIFDFDYISKILLLLYSFVNYYFVTEEKLKDIFKFSLFISILLLYNNIIYDFDLNSVTIFRFLGYIVTSILIIRTILIKYYKNKQNIDTLEYIIFGIIYFLALFNYQNEIDGMLFGIIIIAIMIISNIYKYGALFMISFLALLLNVFILTREFWFSLPWWLYLLCIGSILIGIAIKNEISDKKTEINITKIFSNLKDKIDKK